MLKVVISQLSTWRKKKQGPELGKAIRKSEGDIFFPFFY